MGGLDGDGRARVRRLRVGTQEPTFDEEDDLGLRVVTPEVLVSCTTHKICGSHVHLMVLCHTKESTRQHHTPGAGYRLLTTNSCSCDMHGMSQGTQDACSALYGLSLCAFEGVG